MIQSVALSTRPLEIGYWPLMLPEARPRHALILGLGGATIPHLLVERFGPLKLTAVEKDPTVVSLAYRVFGVPAGTEVVQADAFEFLETTESGYDYIAADLFEVNDVPRQLFTQPLLRKLRGLLTPGGLVAINYFRDRRAPARQRRLESVFPRVTVTASGKNLVAHCRAR